LLNPMSAQTEELLEMAEKHARGIMIGSSDELLTCFCLMEKDGSIDMIATPWRDDKEKNILVMQVAARIVHVKPVAYSFVSECWAITRKKDEKHDRPMNCPDRREGVFILVSDGHERAFRSLDTIREAGEESKCLDLKLRKQDDEPAAQSWIANLLDFAMRGAEAIQETRRTGGGIEELIKNVEEKTEGLL
jgi:hypothetical protein